MTPLALVRRTRRQLALIVVLHAVLLAIACGVGIVIVAAAIDAIAGLPGFARIALLPLVAIAALACAAWMLWRGRSARSLDSIALWIEERQPHLRFALVTAIDPGVPAHQRAALEDVTASAEVDGLIRSARRSLLRSFAAAAVAVVLLLLISPGEMLRAAGVDVLRRAGVAAPRPLANRLADMSARVTPPAYTGMDPEIIEDVSAVRALIGSDVRFAADGPPEGVTGTIDSVVFAAASARLGWSIGLIMPDSPAIIAFEDREYRRLVVLDPVADSVPAVRLRLPASDTTYQTIPRGDLVIEAELGDDIGIGHAYFEYMLSAGSNESFETRVMNGARHDYRRARSGTLREVLDLDTMSLAPGTVLHIRAIAFDLNDVTGPGRGVSDTRTLRIAEPEDSTSINPTPPLPIDSMWMSQRRLNMETDTLIREAPQLARAEFTHTSSGYGNSQEDIRQRAMAVIAILEDDAAGGTFQTETSIKLREAVELMYEARVQLAIAQPDSAMPYMIRVLAILDEIRLANRYYLRGVLRPVAVNVERVRLTGEDPGSREPRTARSELDNARRRLAERLARATALARSGGPEAVDSLTYIRVSALRDAPAVAEALADALAQLQQGESADDALTRAVRALDPPPARVRGPLEWRGIEH